MILYAHQVFKNAFSIIIQTVDTDILVLVIAAAARCDNKHLQSPIKALALPVFHAFTDCDMVSLFKSIGKTTACWV